MHFTTVLLSAVLGAFSVTASPVPDEVLALEARAGKTVSYDCGPSGTPQICLNICWAVHCRGLPEDLHGGGGAAAVKNHRTEWGYGYETKWKQYQWNNQACTSPDEYPYASSKEGGLDGAGKTLALRCVPSVEQSRQGAKVKGIATSTNTDVWDTDISTFTNLAHLKTLTHPVAGATYDWCESTTKCVNDGHQFTATSKGVFALG